MSRNGFTLIELLVVVAVIAVLASMLLVAVNLVRSSADNSRCANSMRQLHLANCVYQIDHDGMVMQAGLVQDSGWSTWYYWDAVPSNREYLGVTELLTTSPPVFWPTASAKLPRGMKCPTAPDNFGYERPIFRSFGYNMINLTTYPVIGGGNPGQSASSIPISTIRNPSQFVEFMDANDGWIATPRVAAEADAAWANHIGNTQLGTEDDPAFYQNIMFRHNSKANAVFWDGHAGSIAYAGFNETAVLEYE